LRYRYRETFYDIAVRRVFVQDGENGVSVAVDGVTQEGNLAHLVDDGRQHRIDVGVISRPADTVEVTPLRPLPHVSAGG
jgi:hypothetical protein